MVRVPWRAEVDAKASAPRSPHTTSAAALLGVSTEALVSALTVGTLGGTRVPVTLARAAAARDTLAASLYTALFARVVARVNAALAAAAAATAATATATAVARAGPPSPAPSVLSVGGGASGVAGQGQRACAVLGIVEVPGEEEARGTAPLGLHALCISFATQKLAVRALFDWNDRRLE